MDLTQIRYFLTLARTRNFTRAAEVCGVTQPAFSRAIQKLEEALGGPLLLRERGLTQLTDLGQAMLPLLQQTQDAAEAVRLRAEERRRGDDPAPLRLGIAPEVDLDPLMPLLREVAARVDGVEIALLRRAEDALVDALLEGTLHLGVLPLGAPLPERLAHWPLWRERVMVLAAEDHPLAGPAGEGVTAEALIGHPLLQARHRGVAQAFAALREAARHVPHEAEGPAEAAVLVRLGLALALVPAGLPVPPGTISRPLAAPEASFQLALVAPAGRPMNRAVSAFAKLARARGWAAEG